MANNALHRTAIRLRSIAAADLNVEPVGKGKKYRKN